VLVQEPSGLVLQLCAHFTGYKIGSGIGSSDVCGRQHAHHLFTIYVVSERCEGGFHWDVFVEGSGIRCESVSQSP
jgi:hypothetical protein